MNVGLIISAAGSTRLPAYEGSEAYRCEAGGPRGVGTEDSNVSLQLAPYVLVDGLGGM